MKAHLLYRSRDFEWKWALQAAAEREATRTGRRLHRNQDFDPRAGMPWNADALTADLALDTLFHAMGRDDEWVFEVARKIILTAATSDLDTIRYRQDILQDCLRHPAVIRRLYAVAVEAMEKQQGHYVSALARYPDSVLRDAIGAMTVLVEFLKELRAIADSDGHRFESEGCIAFFAMLRRDLGYDYLATVQGHLQELRFRNGELLGVELGNANKGKNYVLHRTDHRPWTLQGWWNGLFEEKPPSYRFELHPRDEAGAIALGELRNRGTSQAADALGQSADHVREFFAMLRAEIAFYIGCLNLHEELVRKAVPVCIPSAAAPDHQRLSFRGLYDASLALTLDRPVIGNDAEADDKEVLIVTGPNTGGKSTFLRSVGLAQLMMQSGMFAPAESFCASLCNGLLTHYKREEDVTMESGKFDEELGRMSRIVDHVAPYAMLLLNESFAATNEREGSEIARQIMSALLERKVRIVCVTHLYELAHGFYERNSAHALFLRAGRQADGGRTFKVLEGEPLPTSFGEDLYDKIFVKGRGSEEAHDSSFRPTA